MYAAVTIFIFMCIGATTLADHHQPCNSPNMTGLLTVYGFNDGTNAGGDYVYDTVAKMLRFKTNETLSLNTTLSLDVLMFFKEGVFYEINSRNQTCKKKSLQSVLHPLEIPSDAKFLITMIIGSPTVEGEGLKFSVWTGTVPETNGRQAHYSLSVTMGCLPLSTIYMTAAKKFIISNLNTKTEIKDPDVFTLPSFCEGEALEETPEGTVNSFFNLFT